MTRSDEIYGARERLSELRREESAESFRKRLNSVHAEFSERGRMGGGYHIRAMFDVAMDEATGLADLGEAEAASLFMDECASVIVAWITNPAGRTDSAETRKALKNIATEYRDRLSRQLERRRLEVEVTQLTLVDAPRAKRDRRSKPGPAPDPDWAIVVSEVAAECASAGYTKALRRGDKAAIETMLLDKMADRQKTFSEDAARKYRDKVVELLPDG